MKMFITKMNAPSQSRAGRSLNFPTLALSVGILLSGIMTGTVSAAGAGGSGAQANTFDATVKSGVIEINFTPQNKPDSLVIYYPPRAKGGKQIYTTGGPVVNATVQNPLIATFSGTSTLFEIVVNEGTVGDPSNVWSYSGAVKDSKGATVMSIRNVDQTTSTTAPAPTPAVTPAPKPAPRIASTNTVARGYYRINLRRLSRTLTQ